MAVYNESPHRIYFLIEDTERVGHLESGMSFPGRQEGIAIPAMYPYQVYKTSDHIDVYIDANSQIFIGTTVDSPQETPGDAGVLIEVMNATFMIIQEVTGGWKDSEWGKDKSNWKKLFESADPSKAASSPGGGGTGGKAPIDFTKTVMPGVDKPTLIIEDITPEEGK